MGDHFYARYNFDDLVKSQKTTFYESILYLVFSVWLFNKLVYQHIFETKH